MKSNSNVSRIIELNIAMLFMSTSGVLGRFIEMPPPLTIWWRCLLAAVFLGLFCWNQKIDLSIRHKKDLTIVLVGGLFLGGHWVTYFFALQYSSVAIGMLSLFTYPAITAFLEPIILKTRFKMSHILSAIIVIVGIYLLAPNLSLENNYTKGIVLGLLSAFLYSLRNLLLKDRAKNYHGSTLMFYQMLIVVLALTPVWISCNDHEVDYQWPALITLALITTAVGHTLFVISFKHFSISTASIMSSIQPIYGILLGIVFLNEVPGLSTAFGGALILATVVIESVRSFK
ncbi:MAG: DMT family transporter [Bacteroidota bacterium]